MRSCGFQQKSLRAILKDMTHVGVFTFCTKFIRIIIITISKDLDIGAVLQCCS